MVIIFETEQTAKNVTFDHFLNGQNKKLSKHVEIEH